MEGEPVDRRGLFRDMFRQATNAIVPALGVALPDASAADPHPRADLGIRLASSEQLRAAAAELGLEQHLADVERLARRSLRIAPAAHAGSSAVGFGGAPLLNDGQAWPRWKDRPLTFLAQIDTGTSLGRLLFFYDTVGRPTGCLAGHAGTAAVLQANDGRLSAGSGPALPQTGLPGALAAELLLPRASSEAVEALGLTAPEREAWQALREALAKVQGTQPADRPGAVFTVVHRVFGYTDSSDREMPLICELTAAGEDVIEGRAHLHPRAGELASRAGRWELLGQFSGDGKLGWPWVTQRVYFWADREALTRGELGEVWAIAR
jgi:hypothetical protein